MDYYKATYNDQGRVVKGELEFGATQLKFTGKKGGELLLDYKQITSVNPPNPVAIFFKVLFFPFTLLYWILLIFTSVFSRANIDTGGHNSGTKIRIFTTDQKKHVFRVYRRGKRALRELRSNLK
jgi:hypothetical protein